MYNTLDEIMKPYFDKLKEMEENQRERENRILETKTTISDMKATRLAERKNLEIELENLRVRNKISIKEFEEKKEREIEEYISSTLNSNSSFFASYGSMLRKDLEKEYDRKLEEMKAEFARKEADLIEKISKLKMVSDEEREEKSTLEQINKPYNFRNVDLRELVEIKENLRKKLLDEQKRLNYELKREQINFDSTMLAIDDFEYQYDPENRRGNGAERLALFQKSGKITDKMNEIKKSLKKLEEYLTLTLLTPEETKALMSSMTHWEKDEYNRRKVVDIYSGASKDKDSDIVEVEDPIKFDVEEQDDKVVAEDKSNLFQFMYNDIVNAANNLATIKINSSNGKLGETERYISSKEKNYDYELNGTIDLEEKSVNLPCGEYLNIDDVMEAIENLYNKNKGRSFVVNSTGKEYKVSKFTIKKLKQKLKKCSRIKLIEEKKISKFDLFRVFGKHKSDKLVKEVEMSSLDNVYVPEGEYISRDDLIIALDNLFTTKKLDWLRTVSEKLTSFKDVFSRKIEEQEKDMAEPLKLDDDFRIIR